MIKIAVLGYGTIGSGVVEVIQTNRESINKKIKEELSIKYVLDLREFPGDPIETLLVHDFETIIQDEEISIIVEAMGGTEPAYTFVKQALGKGIAVATSNKELVAKYGAELLALAEAHTTNFLFEASVGGGIPIIRPLNHSLTAEEITEISGILNGTTNYMLTKMADEGMDFAAVLKEAQEKGYAERHPEADIEGHDACRKIAILSSLAYGKKVNYEEIYTEGITRITDVDFQYANAMNYSIKLLGTSRHVDGNYYALVAPMLLPKDHLLAGVKDVFNAVLVHGNMLDDAMFYGRGAGKLPTASAVVADVIEEARHIGVNINSFWSEEKLILSDINHAEFQFFVRLNQADRAKAEAVFEGLHVVDAGIENEFGFVTAKMKQGEFFAKLDQFNEVLSRIRLGGIFQ